MQFSPRGSWVALVTPMQEDGGVDENALGRLIDAHVAAGTDGIVLAGTTGESAALDETEYATLLEAAIRCADGRLPLMAGVGSPATRKAVSLAAIAEGLGVDALLCVTPYYLRTTQKGLEGHYHALTDAVDLPLVLYNVPSRTGVDLLPETVGALSRLESVVGIKEAVADPARIDALVDACAVGFAIMSGDDASCLDTLQHGGVGVISVTANVVPGSMVELCDAARDENWGRAKKIQAHLAPLHRALMAEPNPIPVKALLHRLGRIGPGIRRPLVPASGALVEELMQMVRQDYQSELL
ncbi:MAG: 4-hydroxy-tetrahydrodipicolinate synthase [Xanthomonadales bacterium]|nr:4-hydroxy-tetrahydrodipicolinate synthase [Xanthomonadales bacterium]